MQRVTGECLPCIPAQWELNDRTSISLSKHCRGPDIAFPVVTVGIVLSIPPKSPSTRVQTSFQSGTKRLLRKAHFGSGDLKAFALKPLPSAQETRISCSYSGQRLLSPTPLAEPSRSPAVHG